jgi:hypothetical protein
MFASFSENCIHHQKPALVSRFKQILSTRVLKSSRHVRIIQMRIITVIISEIALSHEMAVSCGETIQRNADIFQYLLILTVASLLLSLV